MKRAAGYAAALAAILATCAALAFAGGVSAHAATGDVIIGNTRLETYSGTMADGTDTYQAFYCGTGEMLVSATADRQIGSEDAVALDIVDHEADRYPDGIVVAMRNATGETQGYHISLICGDAVTL
jgi:hypothetical protein